jgi:hypothetical protein
MPSGTALRMLRRRCAPAGDKTRTISVLLPRREAVFVRVGAAQGLQRRISSVLVTSTQVQPVSLQTRTSVCPGGP